MWLFNFFLTNYSNLLCKETLNFLLSIMLHSVPAERMSCKAKPFGSDSITVFQDLPGYLCLVLLAVRFARRVLCIPTHVWGNEAPEVPSAFVQGQMSWGWAGWVLGLVVPSGFPWARMDPRLQGCTSGRGKGESLQSRASGPRGRQALRNWAGREQDLHPGTWEPAYLSLAVTGLRHWAAAELNHGTTCRVCSSFVWERGRMNEALSKGLRQFFQHRNQAIQRLLSALFMWALFGGILSWRCQYWRHICTCRVQLCSLWFACGVFLLKSMS